MNQQFQVNLVDYQPRVIWTIVAVSAVVIIIPIVLGVFVKNLSFFWFIAFTGAYFYFLIWFARQQVRECMVSVLDDRLLISGFDAGRPTQVIFSEVVSYRYMVTRGGEVLRFKLAGGRKVKLVANVLLGKTGDFNGLVKYFLRAAEQYHFHHPSAMAPDTGIF